MENFIYDNFIRPIWERSGYNPVNTTVYAIIAIAALYLIYELFRRKNIVIDRQLIYATLPFVLFGSTMRVVTDAIERGVFTAVTPIHQLIINSHIYDYGYLTVTPGIYIVVAAIFLLSLTVLHFIKKKEYLPYVGLTLWLFHFLLLIPFMKYAYNALPVIVLAALPALLAAKKYGNEIYTMVVAGHALDGAATYYVIDVFSKISGIVYFEQHVIGSFIGKFFGTYFAFYLVKVLIAVGIVHVLANDKEDDDNFKNFVALAIMIMGFAPGIRDVLRMIVGA